MKVRTWSVLGRLIVGATCGLWSAAGLDAAPPVEEQEASSPAYVEPPLDERDRRYWAFAPLARHALPAVTRPEWARTGLDVFIQARWDREGLGPAPAAPRRAWLRRVSFDVRGLPPTRAEQVEFMNELGPDAAARIVDRWLAAPLYGQRRARLWLDLARFAETDGFEHDLVRREAWRYRDWVIASFNADLPYDEFVRWQIAGDLIAPREPAANVATGFLLSGPDMPDLNSQDERRHVVLNEMTATIGAVFLGLQLGCAECHDHKYDPLSLADFYRLRACLEGAELFREQRLNSPAAGDWTPDYLRPSADAQGREQPLLARAVRTANRTAAPRWYVRGDFRRPGGPAVPAPPRVLATAPGSFEERVESTAGEAGRRRLAEWLAGDEQPLADRVIVNRLWQELFGAGLAASASDLGQLGDSPTHPELLDWLALSWRRQGRSGKRWLREALLSSTYAQSVGRDATAADRWLAGTRRRRLDGEALRDAMLAVSGERVRDMGGPGVRPPLPPELVATLLKGQWDVSSREADHYRSSVYLFVRRNLPYPWLSTFDRPDASASCPVRHRTTTAPQALSQWNSAFTWGRAQALAALVMAEASTEEERLQYLAETCFGRRWSQEELREARAWLAAAAAADPAGGELQAWSEFARTALCLNEFLYLD